MGPKVWNGEINGKAEIDFFDKTSDNSFRPRVRHLYMVFNFTKWNLLLGQAWDVIGPLGPATLNTNGYLWNAGNIGFRRTQARFTCDIELSNKFHLKTQLSVNRNTGILSEAHNTGVDSGWPLMESRVSVSKKTLSNKLMELGVGGLYGKEEIDKTNMSEIPDNNSWIAPQWGVIADILIPLLDKVTIKGELFLGRNLDAFLAGIGQGINIDKEKSILAHGGWAQISYALNKSFTLNSGFGTDAVDSGDINHGDRAKNQTLFINLMFSPIKDLEFGGEYSYWHTEYLGLNDGNNNKIQGSVIWHF